MKQRSSSPFVFATGGTGGHIFPAVAIAQKMLSPVLFAGAKLDENEYITHTSHQITSIPSAPLHHLKAPFIIARGIWKAYRFLRKVKPQAVVGFGSYHSFPILVAAKILRLPILLFEPNAVMGKVNAFFARYAHTILSQFPIHTKAVQMRMPLRSSERILQEDAKRGYGFSPEKKVVLIFGGSQGAQFFETLPLSGDFQVLHIVGKHSSISQMERKYTSLGIQAVVIQFEAHMERAWSAADCVICRSGAMTIAEQKAFGVPALFIPYPFAGGNHQKINAEYVVKHLGNARVLLQENLSEFQEVFAEVLAMGRKEMSFEPYKDPASIIEQYYFIGIGGIGMSSLAHIMLDRGMNVGGSDIRSSHITQFLTEKGAKIDFTQNEETVPPFATVIYSSAIPKKHPQRKLAEKKRLPFLHRSDMLARLMQGKHQLLVTGTHGKTSTSALLSYTLCKLGKDPLFSVGGILKNFGKNGQNGKGEFAVAEADESDGTFLNLACHSAIITNIEPEHLDYYKDERKMKAAYLRFIAQIRHHLLWCADDPVLFEMSPHGVSYGFREESDVRIVSLEETEHGSTFAIQWDGEEIEEYSIPLNGRHMVLNACGVVLMVKLLGMPTSDLSSLWKEYTGVSRRLDFIGNSNSIEVYDDYAHHPTEVLATLKALKKKASAKRIVVVFQPHRYSRFELFLQQFAVSLQEGDLIFITDVYAAGEKPRKEADPKVLLALLAHARYVKRENLVESVHASLRQDDVVITLGAGDITNVAKEIFARLST